MSSQTTLRRLVTGRQREDAAEVALYISTRLDREFAELVKRVFSDARVALGRPLSAARCTVLAEATELSFKRALATTLGKYNDKPKHSPSSGPALRAHRLSLPDELWLMIWLELSMDDRIPVSRVCGAWRTLALASPKLWSHLTFFTDRHSPDDCGCDTCCALENGYSMSCSQGHEVSAVGRTNVNTIRCLIARSRHLPLSLVINIDACTSDADLDDRPFLTLATALRPHASRIVRIHINDSYINDRPSATEHMAKFFAFFKELPALRWLTLGEEPRGYQLMKPIALPVLRYLDIGGCLEEEPVMRADDGTPLSFPSVLTLHYKVSHESSVGRLILDLERFPNLDALRISKGRYLGDPDDLIDMHPIVNAALARIPHVYVDGVEWHDRPGVSSEKRFLLLLHHPSRPTFALSYDESCRKIDGDRIFADLSDSIDLTFNTDGEHGCTADAIDSSGIRRCIQCPPGLATGLYKHISLQTVILLTVHASIFHIVMLGLDRFTSLRRLIVVLSADSRRLPTATLSSGHSALPTLRLEGLSGQEHCIVRAADLAAFVQRICGVEVPDSLELVRVRIEGDIDSRLAGVVREIR